MEELKFLVQGSAAEPYQVAFVRNSPTSITCVCSCPAGENGKHCKHRVRILEGATDGLVNFDQANIELVLAWIHGTELERCVKVIQVLDREATLLNARLKNAKKDLVEAMRGGQ